MKGFSRTINLRAVWGSQVSEVSVTRTADYLFWCTARTDGVATTVPLGPVRVDTEYRVLEPQFDLAAIGGGHVAGTFLNVLIAHLVQEDIMRAAPAMGVADIPVQRCPRLGQARAGAGSVERTGSL